MPPPHDRGCRSHCATDRYGQYSDQYLINWWHALFMTLSHTCLNICLLLMFAPDPAHPDKNSMLRSPRRFTHPHTCSHPFRLPPMFAEDPAHPDKINAWAARMGLPKQVCLDLINPGFKDPFDTRKVCVHRCLSSTFSGVMQGSVTMKGKGKGDTPCGVD